MFSYCITHRWSMESQRESSDHNAATLHTARAKCALHSHAHLPFPHVPPRDNAQRSAGSTALQAPRQWVPPRLVAEVLKPRPTAGASTATALQQQPPPIRPIHTMRVLAFLLLLSLALSASSTKCFKKYQSAASSTSGAGRTWSA